MIPQPPLSSSLLSGFTVLQSQRTLDPFLETEYRDLERDEAGVSTTCTRVCKEVGKGRFPSWAIF